jgi:hypothetical protein
MTFDNKLKWTPHLKKLKSTYKIRMNILKFLSHHTWGVSTKSLITIYKSLILSQIQYGFQIYITAKKNLLQILDPIHNEGIRLSIRAFRTSPTDSILCYAGELPLNLLREKDLLYYGIKTKSTPDYIGYNNIQHNYIGYKSAQGVGFAITQDNIIFMHRLPPETCIFSAESLAIYYISKYSHL